MMRRRSYLLLLSALVLLTALSCTRESMPGEPGSIALSLSTGAVETKAGDGNVADGGGIYLDGEGNPDLLIAIFNSRGQCVARYPAEGELVTSSVTASVIEFLDINPGTYTVYAVANALGLDAATRTGFASATSPAEVEALQVLPSPGDPAFLNARMPLSAKGSVTVTSGGRGQVNLDMLRIFARVSLSFLNETGDPITLSGCSVTLEKMNPRNAYLVGRAADYVTAPAAEDLTLSHADPVTVGHLETSDYGNLSALVFPSKAPAHLPGYRYLAAISFTIGGVNYSYSDLPVHDRRSADIQTVGRNQHLKIETRIGKKTEAENVVSFHFEVVDWKDGGSHFVWFH